VIAGVLSAVFGISLGEGVTIDAIAAEHGAGIFQGNVTYIFAMGGAFLTNLVWFGVVHTKEKTWGEFLKLPESGKGLGKHYLWGSIAGILWYVAFLFYGVGHVRMGEFGFISWGVHMAMLVFFSFGIGLILKEWKNVCKKTSNTLLLGLLILLGSFTLITYGSYVGQQNGQAAQSSGH
jgi:L-rhamnose-H+ transport protein